MSDKDDGSDFGSVASDDDVIDDELEYEGSDAESDDKSDTGSNVSDESDEEDEREITRNMLIDTFHPECKIPDHFSVQNATIITNDEKGHISDELHTTTPMLTKFERAKVIGFRAQQLAYGARPMIEVPSHISDVVEIAELELKMKKLPFIVRRPLPDGSSEYWKLKDLVC